MQRERTKRTQVTYTTRRSRYENLSDSDLIGLYIGGDEGAFTVIYNRYNERLLQFVGRKLRDRHRAEELVQETFLRVSLKAHRFDRSRKFSTWIYTIASNLTKNEFRDRDRNPEITFSQYGLHGNTTRENDFKDPTFVDPRADPSRDCQMEFLGEDINTALEAINPVHRKTFELRHGGNLSYQEIASIMDIRLGTVKSRLFRATESMGELLIHHNE